MAMNTVLKVAFIEAGKKQIAVAQETGIENTKLSRIIHGYCEPSDEEKKAIAKALRRKVDHLFPEVAA